MSVQAATSESINTAFAAMGKQLDLCNIANLAEKMGIHLANGGKISSVPSMILGTNNLSPIDLAEAYAGFANDGIVCTPTAIDSVTEADGTKITPTKSSCTQGVDPAVAGTVDYALQGVLTGNGTAASANPNDSIPKFAKTGTTDSDVQNWLVASRRSTRTRRGSGTCRATSGSRTRRSCRARPGTARSSGSASR